MADSRTSSSESPTLRWATSTSWCAEAALVRLRLTPPPGPLHSLLPYQPDLCAGRRPPLAPLAPLAPLPGGVAGEHDDHGERHRHPQRQHYHHPADAHVR
eukprot:4036801-Prymnesium_polylepis.1